ncbi:MAG: hypothetical protein ACI4LC_00085 [Emergencia sp.]
MTRVYVKQEYQGKGYGSFIMGCLENEIAKQYSKYFRCIITSKAFT